jgi:serine/threonine protein kinase
MEYMPGGDLASLIKAHGKLPPTDCAKLLLAFVHAMIWLRELGLVHLDLKPHNLLLDRVYIPGDKNDDIGLKVALPPISSPA